MRLALLTAFYWLRATLRRARCSWSGCIPADAHRHFVAGDVPRVVIGVSVHCRRCWRRYTHDEQQRAVKYLQETMPR